MLGHAVANWIDAHWLDWATAAIVAVVTWFMTSAVVKPIMQFLGDRRRAIEILHTDAALGSHSNEERVDRARNAVRQEAARLAYYTEAGPMIVRIYCLARRYDLSLASAALRGLGGYVGSDSMTEELYKRQCDAVRVCLGATRSISRERVEEIRQMIRQARIGQDRKDQ